MRAEVGMNRIGLCALVAFASVAYAKKPSKPTVTGMAAGNTHTCLLLSDGTVSCVGDFTNDAPKFTDNWHGLKDVKALSAGGVSTCAVGKNGAACFTIADPGAAGPPPALPANTVQAVIAAGTGCARSADGHVACWGELSGNGKVDAEQKPVTLSLDGVVEVAMGWSARTCVRLETGKVMCWGMARPLGANGAKCTDSMCPGGCSHHLPPGAVGRADEPALVLAGATVRYQVCARPIEVPELAGATKLALSIVRTCGVFKDGSVACVGPDLPQALPPKATKVAGLDHVTELVMGGEFGCALIKGGTVRCFGSNANGELGDGKAEPKRDEAKPVKGLAGVIEVAAGAEHACARLKSGAISCWGSNHPGQLGDGTRQDRDVPTLMKR
jgi:alpha-tubulin suppressor-like RCC1 family protein